jgi:hypothetical protein
LVPQRICFASLIQPAQIAGTREPGTSKAEKQILHVEKEIITVAIQAQVQPEQGRKRSLQTRDEILPALAISRNRCRQLFFETRKQAIQVRLDARWKSVMSAMIVRWDG